MPFYYKNQIISGGSSGSEFKVIPLTLYGRRWDMLELGGQFVDWPSEINMDFANQIVIPYPALPVSNVDSYYAANIRLSPKNLNGKMFFTGGYVDVNADISINLYVSDIDDPNGCVFNINPVNNADYIRSVNYEDLRSDNRILYLRHPIRPMTKEYYDAAIGEGMDLNDVVCLITDGPYIIYNGETMFGSQTSISNAKGFVVQATAPSNTNLLWIDTTANTGGLKYHNGSAWVHVPVGYT